MKKSVAMTVAMVMAVSWTTNALASDTDLQKFQGVWIMVSKERNGEKKEIAKTVLTFKDDKFTTTTDDKGTKTGTIKLNPARSPKTYDVTSTGQSEDAGKTYHGIYEIQDGTLKICVNVLGMDQPTEFATKPGSNSQLVVWKRPSNDRPK